MENLKFLNLRKIPTKTLPTPTTGIWSNLNFSKTLENAKAEIHTKQSKKVEILAMYFLEPWNKANEMKL